MPAIRFYFVIILITITANLFSQQLPLRKQNFDNDWKFAFGSANNPAKDFNYGITTIYSKSGYAPGTPMDVTFRDSSWRKLNVPHDWVVELPFVNSKSDDVTSHGYNLLAVYFRRQVLAGTANILW